MACQSKPFCKRNADPALYGKGFTSEITARDFVSAVLLLLDELCFNSSYVSCTGSEFPEPIKL